MKKQSVIVAGSAPDTGNLGVNALCYAATANLKELNSDLDITVLDHGNSFRENAYQVGVDKYCNVMGAKLSKKFYEPSSYLNISISRQIPFLNTTQKSKFKAASAVLDISGGDSFTDLYGLSRFKIISYPKKLAMDFGLPLVLLPQTYGPFENTLLKEQASVYVKYASLAYARDKYSFSYMQEMLGDAFDPHKHFLAVDVAYILPVSNDDVLIKKNLLPPKPENKEIFGLNISGLIYQNPDAAKDHYKITIDYNALVQNVIEMILQESDGEIWLIPHVLAPQGHYESDNDACFSLKEKLPEEFKPRVHVISGDYDQCDIKGVIKHCSWFCGTRMHSTIGALSSGVPTLGLAYSGKFQGVFASADQEKAVVDARGDNEQEIFDHIMTSWANREATRKELEISIPKVKEMAKGQMQNIVDLIGERV